MLIFTAVSVIFTLLGALESCDRYQNKKGILLDTLFVLVAGTGFEPRDLRVMSPTSYLAAPPRIMDYSIL